MQAASISRGISLSQVGILDVLLVPTQVTTWSRLPPLIERPSLSQVGSLCMVRGGWAAE